MWNVVLVVYFLIYQQVCFNDCMICYFCCFWNVADHMFVSRKGYPIFFFPSLRCFRSRHTVENTAKCCRSHVSLKKTVSCFCFSEFALFSIRHGWEHCNGRPFFLFIKWLCYIRGIIANILTDLPQWLHDLFLVACIMLPIMSEFMSKQNGSSRA